MLNKNLNNLSTNIIRITTQESQTLQIALRFILNNMLFNEEKGHYYIQNNVDLIEDKILFEPEEMTALNNFLRRLL